MNRTDHTGNHSTDNQVNQTNPIVMVSQTVPQVTCTSSIINFVPGSTITHEQVCLFATPVQDSSASNDIYHRPMILMRE